MLKVLRFSELPNDPTWSAHDDPVRPLEYGAVFCDCLACIVVLMKAAVAQPDLPIGIKFRNAKRLVIDVGALAATGFSSEEIAACYGEGDDWIREMWVALHGDHCKSPGEAHLLELILDAGLPEPQFNIEVDGDTGAWRPAGHRRVRYGE
ncbi:MAG TPA: hypothetical protein VI916_08735 [Acidimicrobiia bacterium]|nr:hypothetical protein [Acidimicrobiia bacterium]